MEIIKKKDFVQIKYTGYQAGKVFDSNIESDLKTLDPKAKVEETFVIVGEGMLVPGLDKSLEDKEVDKEYSLELKAKEAFGERRRDLVQTIPLKIFIEKNINPKPGMVFAMDNSLARIIAVSGARVMTDFNNPMAGKDVTYKFKISRKIVDEKEKAKIFFERVLRFSPEFDVAEKVVVKGPKEMQIFIDAFKDKFKELVGKDLALEIVEKKEENAKKKNPKHGEPGHVHEDGEN